MTVGYTTNLSLAQPVVGTESGTWGDDVNNGITAYLDIAIAGGLAITITTTDVTLTNTQGTSSGTNIGSTTAQYAILNINGAMTAARNLILPSSSKSYIINNATTGGYALTVKGASTTGITLSNGEKAIVAWNGTDYAKIVSSLTTYTTTQTFTGSSSALAVILTNAAEVITVSATAATGTINYDVTTQSVLYYTTNASANWTVNFRGSSGTSLNTLMSTGQSLTVAFMVTQGSTAYYNSAVTIDGNSVTPKWQSGLAASAGNINSIDVYTYTIIKTGSAAFTVLASQTKFA